MRKLTSDDATTRSADLMEQNLERLRTLFPEAFTEGKVDFDALRQLLGGAVEERDERYGLNWHGKRKARHLALTPSTGTLRPCPEESVDWDSTRNIFIEGDNLEVLKLLQKSYAGKVKLIYIDPPYNTGKDFVYPDDFQDNIKNYLELTGQVDSGRKITSNTEASGRFHTDWLNMMYPRLKLARDLLRQDGAIFVSIDDHEVANCRLLLAEIFGEENFVAQIVWQRSKKSDAKLIATIHEYVLCFARDKATAINAGLWRRPKPGIDTVLAQYKAFKDENKGDHAKIRAAMMEWFRNLDDTSPEKAHRHYNWSDDRGLYFAADFAGPDDGRTGRPRHNILHPLTGKPCKKPSTGWRWDEEKTQWALNEVPPRIHFGPDETTIPTRKSYLHEIDTEPFASVFYKDGRSATLEVESLIGKGEFSFPKNVETIAEFIGLVTHQNEIVLDFFAGSGTTGQATWEANKALGGDRRFILVQLPEPIEGKFQTIAELTRTRLKRAATKYVSAKRLLDVGVRCFRLDSTNINEWDARPSDLSASLLDSLEHLKPGRSEQDVLYEVLLKLGLDLCESIEVKKIAGKEVHSVGGGVLMVCLAEKISRKDAEPLAMGIMKWHEQLAPAGETTCVFRDSAFADDVAKSNLAAILDQHGLSKVQSL